MIHVPFENKWMRLAYLIAKDFYKIKKWNKKTTPVAILVSEQGEYISHGLCADGLHAVEGHCDRLETKGSPYSACKWCHHSEHAERKALEQAFKLGIEPHNASIYIYGHYKVCDSCMYELQKYGINTIYILENAEELFDRHNPNTVLDTLNQFAI